MEAALADWHAAAKRVLDHERTVRTMATMPEHRDGIARQRDSFHRHAEGLRVALRKMEDVEVMLTRALDDGAKAVRV